MAEKEPIGPPSHQGPGGRGEVVIRRGRVESVDLFEIKDSELELFEKGSPADLQLNFANALGSASLTATVTLTTATFQNSTTKLVFVVAAVSGAMMAIYLYISWWRNHTSLRDVCKRIRNRIPPEALASENKIPKPVSPSTANR